jgi:hypothetical protein
MKPWVICVLLLVLVVVSIPFVTADKPALIKKGTPAAIDYKRDALAPIKTTIGMKVDAVEIKIDNKWVATIPEDSPLFDIPTTKECLKEYPYGSIQWSACETGGV